MDGMRDQIGDEIIHKTMAGDLAQTVEAGRGDLHPEMAGAIAAAGMTDVQMGLVNDLEFGGFQRRETLAKNLDSFSVHCVAGNSYLCVIPGYLFI